MAIFTAVSSFHWASEFCINNSPVFVIGRFYQQILLTPTSFLFVLSMAGSVTSYLFTRLKAPYSFSAYPALLTSHGIASKVLCRNKNSVDNSFYCLKKNGCFVKRQKKCFQNWCALYYIFSCFPIVSMLILPFLLALKPFKLLKLTKSLC